MLGISARGTLNHRLILLGACLATFVLFAAGCSGEWSSDDIGWLRERGTIERELVLPEVPSKPPVIAASPAADEPPDWQPPDWADHLGRRHLDDYAMGLPLDFQEVRTAESENFSQIGVAVFQWLGPAPPGEPGPSVTVSIHPAVSTPRDLHGAVRGYLENMQRHWPSTVGEPPQRGRLHSMPAVRASYETRPFPDLRILGRVYFLQDDLRGIMIDVKAVGDDAEGMLERLDASACTFQRR